MGLFIGYVDLEKTLTASLTLTNADKPPLARAYGPAGFLNAPYTIKHTGTNTYSFSITPRGRDGFARGGSYNVLVSSVVSGAKKSVLHNFKVL